MILTVPPDLACGICGLRSTTASELLTCSTNPSLRSALIATHGWIDTYAIYSDIIFIIVGMEALLALVQPASRMTPESIIPHTEYLQTFPFRISADILIGSKGHAWNVMTMVGQASALRILLTEAASDTLYPYANENQIAEIIVRYARVCEVLRRKAGKSAGK